MSGCLLLVTPGRFRPPAVGDGGLGTAALGSVTAVGGRVNANQTNSRKRDETLYTCSLLVAPALFSRWSSPRRAWSRSLLSRLSPRRKARRCHSASPVSAHV